MSGIFILSKELSNPVFTGIVFGASHTYNHWRRTPPPKKKKIPAARAGVDSRGPASKSPLLRGENLFLILFFSEINLKIYEETDGSRIPHMWIFEISRYATVYSKLRYKFNFVGLTSDWAFNCRDSIQTIFTELKQVRNIRKKLELKKLKVS